MDFTIKFTEQELDTVLRCLAEQPYKVAAPVIQKLQVEIQKTRQALQETTKVPTDEELAED